MFLCKFIETASSLHSISKMLSPHKNDSKATLSSHESSVLMLGRFGTYISHVRISQEQQPKTEEENKDNETKSPEREESKTEPAALQSFNEGRVVRFRSKDYIVKYNKTNAESNLEHLRGVLYRLVDSMDFQLVKKFEESKLEAKSFTSADISTSSSCQSVGSSNDFRIENLYKMPFRPRKSVLSKIESQFSLQRKLTYEDFFAIRNLFLRPATSIREIEDAKTLLHLKTPPTLAEFKLMEKELKNITRPTEKDMARLQDIFTIHCGPTNSQLLEIKKKFKLARKLTVDDFFEIRSMVKKARRFNGTNILDLQRFLKTKKLTPTDLADLQNFLTISFRPTKKQLQNLTTIFELPDPVTEKDYFDLRDMYKDPFKASEKPLLDFYLSLLPCEHSQTQLADLRRLVQNEAGLINFTRLNSKHNQNFMASVRDYCIITPAEKKSFFRKVFASNHRTGSSDTVQRKQSKTGGADYEPPILHPYNFPLLRTSEALATTTGYHFPWLAPILTPHVHAWAQQERFVSFDSLFGLSRLPRKRWVTIANQDSFDQPEGDNERKSLFQLSRDLSEDELKAKAAAENEQLRTVLAASSKTPSRLSTSGRCECNLPLQRALDLIKSRSKQKGNSPINPTNMKPDTPARNNTLGTSFQASQKHYLDCLSLKSDKSVKTAKCSSEEGHSNQNPMLGNTNNTKVKVNLVQIEFESPNTWNPEADALGSKNPTDSILYNLKEIVSNLRGLSLVNSDEKSSRARDTYSAVLRIPPDSQLKILKKTKWIDTSLAMQKRNYLALPRMNSYPLPRFGSSKKLMFMHAVGQVVSASIQRCLFRTGQ